MDSALYSLTWRSAGISHPGHQRPRNEDAWLALPELGLWLVADGLGGHDDGHYASQAIVDAMAAEEAEEFMPFKPDGRAPVLATYVDRVKEILFGVNRQLHAQATARGPDCCMASTVTALLAVADRCACIWAGDSRLYVLRQQQLFQVTRDHNLEQQWLEEGRSPQLTGGQGQVLTQAIGLGPALQLEVRTFQLMPGDILLLCSDGIYRELSPEEIARWMALAEPAKVVQALSDQVLRGAAPDNLTAVVVRIAS